jgi:hypothetical protein
MPYKSKAERERTHYMTFVNAVAQVCACDQCDKHAAVAQLLRAIIDTEVNVMWADQTEWEGPPVWPERRIRAAYWQKERILLENGGMVLDDEITTPKEVQKEALRAGIIRYRPVLVKRADVLRFWPKQRTDSIYRPDKTSKAPPRAGRPSVRATIRNTLTEMHAGEVSLSRPQKALAIEIVQRNDVEFGAPGWSERTVLKHISDWLKEHGH